MDVEERGRQEGSGDGVSILIGPISHLVRLCPVKATYEAPSKMHIISGADYKGCQTWILKPDTRP